MYVSVCAGGPVGEPCAGQQQDQGSAAGIRGRHHRHCTVCQGGRSGSQEDRAGDARGCAHALESEARICVLCGFGSHVAYEKCVCACACVSSVICLVACDRTKANLRSGCLCECVCVCDACAPCFPQTTVTDLTPMFADAARQIARRVQGFADSYSGIVENYRKEQRERKRLFNLVQELRCVICTFVSLCASVYVCRECALAFAPSSCSARPIESLCACTCPILPALPPVSPPLPPFPPPFLPSLPSLPLPPLPAAATSACTAACVLCWVMRWGVMSSAPPSPRRARWPSQTLSANASHGSLTRCSCPALATRRCLWRSRLYSPPSLTASTCASSRTARRARARRCVFVSCACAHERWLCAHGPAVGVLVMCETER